jgi:hypothetical protein
MKLQYDPYGIFQNSRSPAGLYARQKWLGEAENPTWKNDFERVKRSLTTGLVDAKGILETIVRLFGLHLTVRESKPLIDNALDGLLDRIAVERDQLTVMMDQVPRYSNLKNLPFIESRPDIFVLAATLFMATIFGRDSEPAIISLFEWLEGKGITDKGLWFDSASSPNIMRAMVVHPVFSKSEATELAVRRLAAMQKKTGEWGNQIHFYQTTNALAHLDLQQADAQLERAFRRLFDIQKSDGTWSGSEPEWNTFLVVHALKNKGIL